MGRCRCPASYRRSLSVGVIATARFGSTSERIEARASRCHSIGSDEFNAAHQAALLGQAPKRKGKSKCNQPRWRSLGDSNPCFRRERALKKFFNTIRIYILTTIRSHATTFASSLMRGVSGDGPEGGAGSGVPRRRLVTARLGRQGPRPPGTTTWVRGRSLHGSARHLPAVVGRRAPKETEARPREPKIATVERREASVPRHGTQGASLGAWPAASCAGLTGVPLSTRTFLGAPPTPRFG